jgi:hypothetical protein
MRFLLPILGVGLILFAGWFFFLKSPFPSSTQVVNALRKNNEALKNADITFAGCEFTIKTNSQKGEQKFSSQGYLKDDLNLIKFDTMNVRQASQSQYIVRFQRFDVTDALLDQAEMIVDHLPDAASNNSFSREVMRGLLSKADQRLVFKVNSVLMTADGQEGQPHKDVSAFHAFAKQVQSLENVQSISTQLVFRGSAQETGSMISGAVSFPAKLEFAAKTQNDAVEFGRLFYRYKQGNCPA